MTERTNPRAVDPAEVVEGTETTVRELRRFVIDSDHADVLAGPLPLAY